MQLVIVSLAEHLVFKGDEAGVHDGGLTVMTPVCETLYISAVTHRSTHIMVIKMAISASLVLVARDMLKQIPTCIALEALRMPPLTHGIDDATDDRLSTT